MDLSSYTSKGRARSYNSVLPEKKCLECGKTLESDGSYLSRIRFCTEKCKQKYMDNGTQQF